MFSFWVHSAELLWRSDIHVGYRWMKTSQDLNIDPPTLCSPYLDSYDEGNRSILQLRNGADSCTPLYFSQRGTYTWNTTEMRYKGCRFNVSPSRELPCHVRRCSSFKPRHTKAFFLLLARRSHWQKSSKKTLWRTSSFKCLHLRCAASKNYINSWLQTPVIYLCARFTLEKIVSMLNSQI